MPETKYRLIYCPKCGRIFPWKKGTWPNNPKCYICGHEGYFEVNPKYATDEIYTEIWKQKKYGEKTHEQCKVEEDELFYKFREEVVKTNPDYDPYFFEHREEIIQQKIEEENRKTEEFGRQMQKYKETHPTITCPYCKSTNTKKLSAVSRGLSFSIFGFGSKKIGKQWHCNNCGSDF